MQQSYGLLTMNNAELLSNLVKWDIIQTSKTIIDIHLKSSSDGVNIVEQNSESHGFFFFN